MRRSSGMRPSAPASAGSSARTEAARMPEKRVFMDPPEGLAILRFVTSRLLDLRLARRFQHVEQLLHPALPAAAERDPDDPGVRPVMPENVGGDRVHALAGLALPLPLRVDEEDEPGLRVRRGEPEHPEFVRPGDAAALHDFLFPSPLL